MSAPLPPLASTTTGHERWLRRILAPTLLDEVRWRRTTERAPRSLRHQRRGARSQNVLVPQLMIASRSEPGEPGRLPLHVAPLTAVYSAVCAANVVTGAMLPLGGEAVAEWTVYHPSDRAAVVELLFERMVRLSRSPRASRVCRCRCTVCEYARRCPSHSVCAPSCLPLHASACSMRAPLSLLASRAAACAGRDERGEVPRQARRAQRWRGRQERQRGADLCSLSHVAQQHSRGHSWRHAGRRAGKCRGCEEGGRGWRRSERSRREAHAGDAREAAQRGECFNTAADISCESSSQFDSLFPLT